MSKNREKNGADTLASIHTAALTMALQKRQRSEGEGEKGDERLTGVQKVHVGGAVEGGEVTKIVVADRRHTCPYLDTIQRTMLDFDFEKVCSVTLSNLNVYACLVCGKFFQGKAGRGNARQVS